ncbi:MAG: PaaI family thioesterase [Candidatus Eremiobacteraeota bacterium]|nr:PaaI family thioesterase [Candidatus Eremiobacteraeota bacterium]MBC5802615.1 PaaI family thioesterase [Candidatus Eremiobacteraeota bacterium]MBC5820643.1 PaaI family thioesterase [Candidatus Eremiobacteraeota bacterium]
MAPFEPRDAGWQRRVRDIFARQGALALLGAKITELEPGRCVAVAPFRPELGQQHGYFHAGVTSTLADATGGCAAATLFGADGDVLAVEFKINLLAPAHGETLVADARVVRSGRTLTVCSIEIFVDRDGKRSPCALMQQTLIRVASSAS